MRLPHPGMLRAIMQLPHPGMLTTCKAQHLSMLTTCKAQHPSMPMTSLAPQRKPQHHSMTWLQKKLCLRLLKCLGCLWSRLPLSLVPGKRTSTLVLHLQALRLASQEVQAQLQRLCAPEAARCRLPQHLALLWELLHACCSSFSDAVVV
jgi:hypothetical protein